MKTRPNPFTRPVLLRCEALLLCSAATVLFYPRVLSADAGLAPTSSPGLNATQLIWQDGARDACSTEKLAVQAVTNATTGEVSNQLLHRYIEVGSGLNYLDGSGVWQPSQDLIELMPDGSAAAIHGPMKAYFSPNLNTAGAITFVTISNRVFKTRVAGLYLYNATTGERQLVSLPRDCTAELLPPNQIVYRSIFQSIKADFRVTYTKAAIETDLILLESPKVPASSAASSMRLELWHEYLNPPTPQIRSSILQSTSDPTLRSSMAEPDLVDQTLDFGDLWYPLGRAFPLSGNGNTDTNVAAKIKIPNPAADPSLVPVAKRWLVSSDGTRTYLIESVLWSSIKAQMGSLPPAGQGALLSNPKERRSARVTAPGPKKALRAAQQGIQVAKSPYRPTGYVLDYFTVSGNVDYTFSSGSTYYLASDGYFSGTLTLQSNSTLKYAAGVYLLGYGSFVFNTDTNSPPTILTSKDDDQYGDPISDSTHVPNYAASQAIWPYYLSSWITVTGVRIRWAQRGVQFETPGGEFDNSVLEICQLGLYANSCSASINNSTRCGVITPVNDPPSFTGSLTDVCPGDSDGDGVPDWMDANPYDPTVGALTITIDSPSNGTVFQ